VAGIEGVEAFWQYIIRPGSILAVATVIVLSGVFFARMRRLGSRNRAGAAICVALYAARDVPDIWESWMKAAPPALKGLFVICVNVAMGYFFLGMIADMKKLQAESGSKHRSP